MLRSTTSTKTKVTLSFTLSFTKSKTIITQLLLEVCSNSSYRNEKMKNPTYTTESLLSILFLVNNLNLCTTYLQSLLHSTSRNATTRLDVSFEIIVLSILNSEFSATCSRRVSCNRQNGNAINTRFGFEKWAIYNKRIKVSTNFNATFSVVISLCRFILVIEWSGLSFSFARTISNYWNK